LLTTVGFFFQFMAKRGRRDSVLVSYIYGIKVDRWHCRLRDLWLQRIVSRSPYTFSTLERESFAFILVA